MTDAPFRYAPSLSAADNGNHIPEPLANWQESSFVSFVDPARGLAGVHRIGIHPHHGTANLFSWTQIDGQMVSQAKRTDLPMPDGPVTGTTLDNVTFETPDPLRICRVRVDRDGVQTDVTYESFTGPVEMSMDVAGARVGKGHYNSLGRVRGMITKDGVSHPVDGVGFLDHSWGARDISGVLAHRWMMAALDKDNHINTFPIVGPEGRSMIGYVMLDGTLSFVESFDSEMTLADDQLSVVAVRARIIDRAGRTVEVKGYPAGAYNIQPLGQGALNIHRPMMFECRGRFWPGMFEWSPVRVMPPWHRKKLGIEEDDEWLQRDGHLTTSGVSA